MSEPGEERPSPPQAEAPIETLIVALPESAGSALYGMLDVLAATGTLWHELVGDATPSPAFAPRIVAPTRQAFRCGNGVPVVPDLAIGEAGAADIIILPELWLAPDDDLRDRHEDLKAWIRDRHRAGSTLYSACSGSVLLAATGLLDGLTATSHWGYQDLFRRSFPRVRFDPAPTLVFADAGGRIVTAGGASSWHDLALHIIARHCGPGEALRIARVYLLKWHSEGQLPFANLVRRQPHADAAVRRAEQWLAANFPADRPVAGAVEAAGIPERSLKRRFRAATGNSLIGHVQNLRVEAAKRMLETGDLAAEEVAPAVGYENGAFFRSLFRRTTGLTPGQYRAMFRPLVRGASAGPTAQTRPRGGQWSRAGRSG